MFDVDVNVNEGVNVVGDAIDIALVVAAVFRCCCSCCFFIAVVVDVVAVDVDVNMLLV